MLPTRMILFGKMLAFRRVRYRKYYACVRSLLCTRRCICLLNPNPSLSSTIPFALLFSSSLPPSTVFSLLSPSLSFSLLFTSISSSQSSPSLSTYFYLSFTTSSKVRMRNYITNIGLVIGSLFWSTLVTSVNEFSSRADLPQVMIV